MAGGTGAQAELDNMMHLQLPHLDMKAVKIKIDQ